MSKSKFNLEQLVEKYNSGVPIPAVEPADLRATLALLTSSKLAFPQYPAGILMDEVAAACGEGADVFAVIIRAAVVGQLLERVDRVHTPEREERLIDSLAKLDLKATEFDIPTRLRIASGVNLPRCRSSGKAKRGPHQRWNLRRCKGVRREKSTSFATF